MNSFKEIGIDQKIIKAIADIGFEDPMPIQREVLPLLLKDSHPDIIAQAQTGTGKTAAFGIPIVQKTDVSTKQTQYLILSPTRELCMQITNDIAGFAKNYAKVRIVAVFGGADIEKQIKKIKKGVHIISATPGRLLDLINRGVIDISAVKTVILDEADEMLNMGFRPDLEAILVKTPKDKSILLFSATMSKEVRTIANRYMRQPIEISVGKPNAGATNIEHIAYSVQNRDKDNVLRRILDVSTDIYGIVFCKTRKETRRIADFLIQEGYQADALNGDLSQAQRDQVMRKFRSKTINLLIATDVAARGLDVDDLTHIINYNLPDDSEVYIHRSGRTGRIGKSGISIALANHKEVRELSRIERQLKKKFTFEEIPSLAEISAIRIQTFFDKLMKVDVHPEKMAAILPNVYKKLEHLNRDEIIQKFVALEFKNLNSKTDQLSEPDSLHKIRKPSRVKIQRKNYTRFFINLGKTHQLKPASLIGMINDFTKIRGINIGEIEILNNFSFFETDHTYATHILDSFKDKKLNKRTIIVERAEAKTTERKYKSRKSKKRIHELH
jgi:ATP-dependent RNA helicase DeaD